jgi:multidrug efflux pump
VGAGANARHSIGTGILGGMLGETTLAMLYVPLFFYLFDRLSERKAAKQEKPAVRAHAAGAPAPSVPHAPREGD